jgi:major membrane immunogen (membrane-anchored lipoprotein)
MVAFGASMLISTAVIAAGATTSYDGTYKGRLTAKSCAPIDLEMAVNNGQVSGQTQDFRTKDGSVSQDGTVKAYVVSKTNPRVTGTDLKGKISGNDMSVSATGLRGCRYTGKLTRA